MKYGKVMALALAGTALTPLGAWAQASDTQVDEVVVTGSNVIRDGYQAPTPVTTLATEQLLAAAPVRFGEALTQLPQFRGSPSPKTSYQPTLGVGGSNASLRNLGANRTLVLVSGRRVVPNSIRGDFDLDSIPSAVIQRVDIATGGASAQYGSDAVGGAVNLILDRKFTGLKGLVQGGMSRYNDGGSWKVELTGGQPFADGRGHFLLSYAHNSYDEIKSQYNDRPWARSSVGTVTVAGRTPRVNIVPNVAQVASYGGAIVAGPLAGTQFLPGGISAPFNLGVLRSAASASESDGTHLSQPVQTAFEGDNFFGRVSFDVTDDVNVYAEGMYTNGRVFYNQAYPIQLVGGAAATIFSGNPYLPANIQAQMAAGNIASFQLQRMNRDMGITFADLKNDTYNLTAGFDAKAGDWEFGGYVGHGKNDGDYVILNNIDNERLYAALDAVRDTNGQIVCRVTVTNPGLYPGCVPINLLGEGSPTAAAEAYIERPLPFQPSISQTVASAYLRGEPVSTWAGPVAVGVGAEWRQQELEQTVDPLSAYTMRGTGIRGFPSVFVGRIGGFGTLNPQPASGSVDVKEAYVEILAPLARDLAWAQSMDLNAAVRRTEYSTSGGVTTWKVGLTWQPVDDVRFRGTYSKDIRAPNLGELYASGSSSLLPINDPTQANRSYLVINRVMPNADLAPEEGKTYALGVVYSPSWLPGFSASLDYFNIAIEGLITTLTPQQTIDACFRGSTFNCGVINRSGPNNDILTMYTPNQNLSALETDGFDLDVSYAHTVADGDLKIRGLASYVPNFIVQAPGAPPINYGGEVGQRGSLASANPRFTGSLTVSYDKGPWGVTVQERVIGRGTWDVTLVEGVDINDNSVPTVWYTDLTVEYRFEARGGDHEAFLTINNLFDETPPLFPTGSSTLPSYYNRALYDGVGRYFTGGLRFRF